MSRADEQTTVMDPVPDSLEPAYAAQQLLSRVIDASAQKPLNAADSIAIAQARLLTAIWIELKRANEGA